MWQHYYMEHCKFELQVALVICGFDYPWPLISGHNLLSVDICPYPWLFVYFALFVVERTNKGLLLSTVLVLARYTLNVSPANNMSRLYYRLTFFHSTELPHAIYAWVLPLFAWYIRKKKKKIILIIFSIFLKNDRIGEGRKTFSLFLKIK